MTATTELTVALRTVPTAATIVSGASPVNADPTVLAYEIQTGGTAGQEVINLPHFDDSVALLVVGRRIVFAFKGQLLTDPGDTVKITVAGGDQIYFYPSSAFNNAKQIRTDSGVLMSNNFDVVSFLWTGNDWLFDFTLSASSTVIASRPVTIESAPGPSPENVNIRGGDATAGDNNGASVIVSSGNPNGDGNGGNIVLSPGTVSGAGHNGYIVLATLPMLDPHVYGAIWWNTDHFDWSQG